MSAFEPRVTLEVPSADPAVRGGARSADVGPAFPASAWPRPRHSAHHFALGQNYPNPCVGETTVPFTLADRADVRLILFDPLGRRLAAVVRKGLGPGEQSIALNLRGMDLAAADYAYQLEVVTSHGVYNQRKTMTTREG